MPTIWFGDGTMDMIVLWSAGNKEIPESERWTEHHGITDQDTGVKKAGLFGTLQEVNFTGKTLHLMTFMSNGYQIIFRKSASSTGRTRSGRRKPPTIKLSEAWLILEWRVASTWMISLQVTVAQLRTSFSRRSE